VTREPATTSQSWPPAGFLHQRIDVAAVALDCWVGGQGHPVLLVPGWPQHAYAWRFVMEQLANDFLVVAVDPRGFGMSDAPDSHYDTGTAARDLSQVMAKFSDKPWTVVGHDVGMWIAYAIATDYSDQCASLVAVDAMLPGITPWQIDVPSTGCD
jgi:pimeloyl-ACP methyl ester carboxylesterase